MQYAQFDSDGVLITQVNDRDSLPKMFRWEDGRVTSGFNTLDDETLAEAGWYLVEGEDKPTFDETTHMLSNERVIMAEGVATRTWDVVEIPPPVVKPPPEPPTPSVEDRVAKLEDELATAKEMNAKVLLLEDEIKGIKSRAAAVNVTNADSVKVKNAIAGT